MDRGIKAGHSDPENFSFTEFYAQIEKTNKYSLKDTEKISQERSEMPSWATDTAVWPPRLTGKER